jgi:hypothetical protein
MNKIILAAAREGRKARFQAAAQAPQTPITAQLSMPVLAKG